jgi:hypothetical protein
MATTVDPSAIFSGAPVSITFGGVECGATIAAPKLNLNVEAGAPAFTNAGGPVKGTRGTRKIIPEVELTINEFTAQKLGWAMPGAVVVSSQSVGQVRAGLDTTLAADPALGATNVKVTSVTTVNVNDFVRIGAAGVAATEANSEVVQVLTVGTTGGGGTGLDLQNSAGGGLLLDHANAEEIKTVTGTTLAAPAVAGATNLKVGSVTALIVGDFVRVGYVGHYETRELSFVGTTGPAGTGISFVVPLSRDHGLGEWVIEVTALGSVTIRPVIGRLPSAAYADLVLTDVGADGRQLIATLENATSDETQTLEFSDDPTNPLGLTLKFTGHYAAATPQQVPFYLTVVG